MSSGEHLSSGGAPTAGPAVVTAAPAADPGGAYGRGAGGGALGMRCLPVDLTSRG